MKRGKEQQGRVDIVRGCRRDEDKETKSARRMSEAKTYIFCHTVLKSAPSYFF